MVEINSTIMWKVDKNGSNVQYKEYWLLLALDQYTFNRYRSVVEATMDG